MGPKPISKQNQGHSEQRAERAAGPKGAQRAPSSLGIARETVQGQPGEDPWIWGRRAEQGGRGVRANQRQRGSVPNRQSLSRLATHTGWLEGWWDKGAKKTLAGKRSRFSTTRACLNDRSRRLSLTLTSLPSLTGPHSSTSTHLTGPHKPQHPSHHSTIHLFP